MTDDRRRWVIYDPRGVPNRWYAQPLYWGLGYLGACCVAQTASAIFWMSRGSGWFDSAGGQQAPILLASFVAIAVVGLSRKSQNHN